MPLTPADVANKQFKIAFRGYSLDEVDAFLDEVEGELGRLLRENNDLKIGRAAAPTFTEAPPVPAAPAPLAPGEGQEAALRTLLLAQRTADEVVAEARAEAAGMVAQAQQRAAGVDAEIAARIHAAMGGLDQRKRDLEVQIEDLRAFEREYRTRLQAYLESQLRDLSTRGAPDDGGAGVPAAARTAAVGLGPAPGAAPMGAPAGPPPGAGSAPPTSPPPPPAPPASAPSTSPPPAAAPSAPPVGMPPVGMPPVGMPPVGMPPAPSFTPSAPPAAPPSYRPAEPPATPPAPTFSAPGSVPPAAPPSVPMVAPSGPPREGDAPTLRAVPPLQTSSGSEPIGPFTIVPPSIFSEQLDDGLEPPAEH